MMKQTTYCSAETLYNVWESSEIPFIVHFESPHMNICKKSKSIFTLCSEKFSQKDVVFLNVILRGDREITDTFVEFKLLKFPALLIYDYGKIIHTFDSTLDIEKELELRIRQLVVSEKNPSR